MPRNTHVDAELGRELLRRQPDALPPLDSLRHSSLLARTPRVYAAATDPVSDGPDRTLASNSVWTPAFSPVVISWGAMSRSPYTAPSRTFVWKVGQHDIDVNAGLQVGQRRDNTGAEPDGGHLVVSVDDARELTSEPKL
jgi:hypothetical protein